MRLRPPGHRSSKPVLFIGASSASLPRRPGEAFGVVPKTHCLGVVRKPHHGKEFLIVHLKGPKSRGVFV